MDKRVLWFNFICGLAILSPLIFFFVAAFQTQSI